MNQEKNTLVIIAGPTAVGKTDIGIQLAKHWNTSIISADSRQCYKELNIGTAKPSPKDLEEVNHFFINHLSIYDSFTAMDFENEVIDLLENLFKKNKFVLLVGGAGLFINAIVNGFDAIPDVSPKIRTSLNEQFEEEGLASLQKRILKIDPNWAENNDLKNPRRVIRALEVWLETGKTIDSFQRNSPLKRNFNIEFFLLEREIEVLYQRINQRVDMMIKNGLFEEAEQLYSVRQLNALKTVGYQELFPFFAGEYDREEAVRLLKRNSRRYAKRQLTWFKKNENIQRLLLNDNNSQKIIQKIISNVEKSSVDKQL